RAVGRGRRCSVPESIPSRVELIEPASVWIDDDIARSVRFLVERVDADFLLLGESLRSDQTADEHCRDGHSVHVIECPFSGSAKCIAVLVCGPRCLWPQGHHGWMAGSLAGQSN